MHPQDLEDACRRYIRGKRSTLWGQFFAVKGEASELEQASEWLAAQVTAVLADLDESGTA